jgi:hypothetical protein
LDDPDVTESTTQKPTLPMYENPLSKSSCRYFAEIANANPLTFMPNNTDQSKANGAEPGMNQVLARNIRTLLEKRRAEESKASVEQKMADSITRFTGSMPFVYLHTAFSGSWILINLGWLAGGGLRPFDPSLLP